MDGGRHGVCGGGDDNPGSSDAGIALTPATSWSLAGQVTVPSGEAATNIKIMASYDGLDVTGGSYVSDVVSMSPTGAPATATFSLDIDTSTVPSGKRFVFVYAFQDDNDDGLKNTLEQQDTLAPVDATCAIWGNGTGFASLAVFQHWNLGETANGTNAWTFEAPATWWYATRCSNLGCLDLIDDSELSGAKLTDRCRLQ